MEKYYKRKSTCESSSAPKRSETGAEIDLTDLPADPGLRTPIWNYNPNIRDQIRRAYLLKGPCQPRNHDFPFTLMFGKERRFVPTWFNEYPNWLEYSIAKDVVYCLCCYLFRPNTGEKGGGDSFVDQGFTKWNKKERLKIHVGGPISAHNQAWRSCEALLNQKQHIETFFDKQTEKEKVDYQTRLVASIDCVRHLLRQGHAFRGHDESENSNNRGDFLELLKLLCQYSEEVNAVTMNNAPKNQKMVAPTIQKDIVSAFSTEITKAVIADIGDAPFSLLVDESRDISSKEQMAIVFRYVNKKGHVIERFLGVEHVTSTTALSLKASIDDFFSRNGLSISRLRGQGYDGASNMKGEFNGLKTLILKENDTAFYIHCFAHQLQLALVAMAKNHEDIAGLFSLVTNVVNVVFSSPKRRDILRERHSAAVLEALNNNEISSGQGLNQEISLKRPADTRWSSHYDTLVSLIITFSSMVYVLEMVRTERSSSGDQKYEAKVLLRMIQSFDFIFPLHLMKQILGITNDLCQALQKKDQDIVNAMALVRVSKERLQTMRDSGWDSLFQQVSSFCDENEIEVPNMDDMFIIEGKSKRKAPKITNLHHYRIELFYSAIDTQLQELNNRFNETTTELLLCVACLSPSDMFSSFDKQRLVRLAQFYPKDFTEVELGKLEDQLENYIAEMRSDNNFLGLKGIRELAEKMVETKKDRVYPLVYFLLTLALVLPVATATVERVFSAMNFMKSRLRNRMGDKWMNDSLLAYIEKDIFDSIANDLILE